eukprot:m.23428 g.23428  ORF g.23428 m.23428 type:complete len:464 (-) comp5542_c0_seq2:659-2050(-)
MTDGIGRVAWWGFSPAQSLLEWMHEKEREGLEDGAQEKNEVNILMIGATDFRHILNTILDARKYPDVQFNIHVIEPRLEVVARHLLLLSLALKKTLGLDSKLNMLLELYGNALIRSPTKTYLQGEATFLIKMITDPSAMKKKMPWITLDQLKYKHRDELEAICKFWRLEDQSAFPITELWDARMRYQYKERYDVRENMFDWDHSMNLVEKAPFVQGRHYKRWRETGIAFELLDAEYDEPNSSLASGEMIKTPKGVVAKRGYWGDMMTGPFIPFGGNTSACDKLNEKRNSKHRFNAVDVTKFNVFTLLGQLKYGPDFKATLENTATGDGYNINVESGHGGKEEDEEDEEEGSDDGVYLPVNNVVLHMLQSNALETDLLRKPQHQNKFSLAFFSNSMVHMLTADVSRIMKESSVIACETAKYMLVLKKDQTKQFADKVVEFAKAASFAPSKKPSVDDDVLVFKRG